MGNEGWTPSEETLKNMRQAQQKRYSRPEERAKISRALKGYTRSAEFCQNVSDAKLRNYVENPEIAQKISKTLMGHTFDETSLQAMRKASALYWSSPEGTARKIDMAERYKGEKSPNWKDGLGSCRDYGPGWAAERQYIIERDNFTCQGCGVAGTYSDFEVHHIGGDPNNWDERDEITTCPTCNKAADRKDEKVYWQRFYANRIKVIYNEGGTNDF